MSDQTPDFIEPLRVLHRHRVRFVLVGGIAGVLRGSTTVTADVDVCYARDEENLEHLFTALREMDAGLRGASPDLPFALDGRTLKAGDHFTFSTDFGDLDCLGSRAGSPEASRSWTVRPMTSTSTA